MTKKFFIILLVVLGVGLTACTNKPISSAVKYLEKNNNYELEVEIKKDNIIQEKVYIKHDSNMFTFEDSNNIELYIKTDKGVELYIKKDSKWILTDGSENNNQVFNFYHILTDKIFEEKDNVFELNVNGIVEVKKLFENEFEDFDIKSMTIILSKNKFEKIDFDFSIGDSNYSINMIFKNYNQVKIEAPTK
ncbi:hypothetical protein [Haploplasma axanthum]|uniref:Lipoprotein n=1 Tax=Haploplasma axanthum TaxID=29552 RepID=A0A449BD01_HAPAX|nr:hypothetical protein [Haploplasma axanthum]VEU80316.1 Uncharacterised protein [Haploplasma axanthum]